MNKEIIDPEIRSEEPKRIDLEQIGLDIEFDGDGKIGFHKDETDHP